MQDGGGLGLQGAEGQGSGDAGLRRALTLCEQIFENAPDPLLVLDRQYTLRMANAAYLRFRRSARSEVIGRKAAEIVGHESFERLVRPEIDRCLAGDATFVEAWVDYPGVGRRYVELYHYPLRVAGRVELAAGLIRDLTERKRAEMTLERYRALFMHARDIILFIDPENGRILEANEAAARTYGYSHDELCALTIYDLRAAEAAPQVSPQMAQAQERGIRFEAPHRRKDGRTFPVEVDSVAVPWNGRTVLLSIIRDISERKQAEAAQARTLAELEAIFRALPDLYFRLAPDGTILDYRAGSAEELYQAPEAFLGRRMGDVLPPQVGRQVRDALRQVQRARSMVAIEYWLPVGGRDQAYEARLLPILDRQTIMIVRNITERREAEAERQRLMEAQHDALEQAEDALRLRDEFLSVAAHELKTPLTSLRGQVELTMRRIEQGRIQSVQQTHKALQVIDRHIDRLANLAAQLLETSRIQSGELQLERQTVDLVPLARSLMETMQAGAERHTLALQAPAALEAHVDPLRFEEVLYNLVDNAIRYSPKGGPVEIELSTPDPGTVRIAVRDRGIGVPPEQREHLFDRFFQVARRPSGGLGLGLYISRRIVELHGGRIWAEFPTDGAPEGPMGSRFVVELPRGIGEVPHRSSSRREDGASPPSTQRL